MKSHQSERVVILLFNDLVAMVIAFLLALYFGHQQPFVFFLFMYYAGGFIVLIASTVVSLFILDLYSLRKLPRRFLNQVMAAGVAMIGSSVVSTFVFFFFRNPVPRAVFILFYVLSWLFIILFRMYFSRKTIQTIYWRVVVVGEREASEQVARMIMKRRYLRTDVVGYVPCDPPSSAPLGLTCLGSLHELPRIVLQDSIDQVIVATRRLDPELDHLLLACMQNKVKVTDYRTVMEEVAGKVPLDYLDDSWFILSLGGSDKRYFWYGKRAFDIAVSLAGIAVCLPFLPLVALLIKLDSRGPVFYTQERVGREGDLFRLWKLRTMVEGADRNNIHWTTDRDARITRFGSFMRKTRLDELPQLFNILKGEMSLIGPRPEAESLSRVYEKEIAYYRERHMVTPGITGWAQINYPYGNSVDDAKEKLKYDFYYIRHRSFLLDAAIFLRTIRTVLTGKGAL